MMPCQWEGDLLNGKMFYVRFRDGFFTLSISNDVTNNSIDAVTGEVLMEMFMPYDDYLSDSEMFDITKELIDWRMVRTLLDENGDLLN